MANGNEMKAEPDWTTWAIKVGGATVAQLPRGATDVKWTPQGLALLEATSGAELMAEVEGR